MSSEKQFEHIENKIKEAAENNHIVFEEKSWKKMEALLDKEDKSKPFIWLWFLLPITLLGSYGLFIFSESSNGTTNKNFAQNNIQKNTTHTIVSAQQILTTALLKTEDKVDEKIDKNTLNTATQTNTLVALPTNIVAAKNVNNIAKKELDNNKYTGSFSNKKSRAKTKIDNEQRINKDAINDVAQSKSSIRKSSKTTTNIKTASATEDELAIENINDLQKNQIPTNEKTTTPELGSKKESTSTITKNSTTKSKAENKKESKILSRFYLLAAAGADIGSVKLFSFGNSSFSAKYGFGIGYDFSKKLSLQAGFYSSKKKYIAEPADYNFKTGTYWTTVSVTKVEAACLIYELPITLQYNFLQRKSFNAYAGAGVSSYIMKNEVYNYFYKRYSMEYSKAYNYTGNQHLFSTALVSLGVQKNISKKLALQLEPSINIPLKGVGDGEVKLYSTSLLLGIKYHPFTK